MKPHIPKLVEGHPEPLATELRGYLSACALIEQTLANGGHGATIPKTRAKLARLKDFEREQAFSARWKARGERGR